MSRLSAAMREAIKVNAERDHFAEAYEGFNDCAVSNGEACDCGKAEAELAWQEVLALEERGNKVWIATHDQGYDGTTVLGVAATVEAGKAIVEPHAVRMGVTVRWGEVTPHEDGDYVFGAYGPVGGMSSYQLDLCEVQGEDPDTQAQELQEAVASIIATRNEVQA